ncbi:MAG: hypothetical protein HC906_13615 [Bacteroidales bacterium]|nr:hypothetical protein [Bacteroidales bacterium]
MVDFSKSQKLKDMISKAIDDHVLTKDEYDLILHLASEDGVIDRQEQILLEQLNEMIETKFVKLVKK